MKTVARIATVLAIGWAAAAGVTPLVAQQRVVVEERSAVVLKKVGNTVIIRNDKGEIKKYSDIPANAGLYIDGKPARIEDLHEGMTIHAIRFQDVPPPSVITMSEVEQPQPAPPARTAAKPVAVAQPEPPLATVLAPPTTVASPAEMAASAARPSVLPKTASPWPMTGLLGLLLVVAALGLAMVRRRSRHGGQAHHEAAGISR